jgi:hypothetical protein
LNGEDRDQKAIDEFAEFVKELKEMAK